MRILLTAAVALLPLPVFAWEAGVDGPLCTLEHAGGAADVRLTYDPALPEYTIAIRRSEPWPLAPVFALSFEGARANLIQTTRHMLSADRRTLSVADRGFGNVLDGLAFNEVARGLTGETDVAIDLAGAAPEVAAFRACIAAPSV
ncbi:MAG: hypothetical protein AAF762_12055 [Pseudomonadota bacterium]